MLAFVLIQQKVMSRILEGLDGVVCQMDKGLYLDTLRRDTITTYKTLPHIAAPGLTLNKEKYVFSKPTINFLGPIISISPDPTKTAAIHNMPPPKSPSDLCQFMGMVTQLGSFTQTRHRLASHYGSHWVQLQEEAFARINSTSCYGVL